MAQTQVSSMAKTWEMMEPVTEQVRVVFGAPAVPCGYWARSGQNSLTWVAPKPEQTAADREQYWAGYWSALEG